MYKVNVDQKRNLLNITIGRLEKDEAGEIAATVLRSLAKMKPGFACITDVSDYEPTGTEVIHYVEKCQRAMAEAGIGKIIRVVGDTPIPKAFLEKTAPKIGSISFHVVKTQAQAAELLDT